MKYGDIPIAFGRAYRSRYIQLFQILLLNQTNGIAKDMLLEHLYGMRESSNQNNSLNNLIFRLRKHLSGLGFPESDDIVIKNGRCWFASEEPIRLDVLEFRQCLEQAGKAKGDEKKWHLLQAVELYQGELLPQISTELWVMTESIQLKRMFEAAIKELEGLLKPERKMRQLFQIYGKAAKIYPFENWQEKEIECLVLMNQSQEAYQLYKNTVKMYIDELGAPPASEYLNRFQDMGKRMFGHSEDLRAIQEDLQENQLDGGAYFCNYPSFVDSYRLMVRLMERSGQSIFLMLCTLVDSKGMPLGEQKNVSQKMGWLFQAMQKTMRRGDAFTKYSSCQYLALLLGTRQEDCSTISKRIDRKYQELSQGIRPEIRYYVTSLAMLPEKTGRCRFQKESEIWKRKIK